MRGDWGRWLMGLLLLFAGVLLIGKLSLTAGVIVFVVGGVLVLSTSGGGWGSTAGG